MATMALPRLRSGAGPRAATELLLIVVFYAMYSLVRVILPDGGNASAFEHAGQILSAEATLGLDIELWLNRMLLESAKLSFTVNVFYATAHFLVTAGILLWLFRRRRQHYPVLRTGLMLATGIALIGYWAYPLAPPRFMTGEGFADPVVVHETPGLYASGGAGDMANQFAAMPSMHAGWALWVAVAVLMTVRTGWIRWAVLLYPTATVLTILATANHYSMDVLAGFAVTAGALGLSWVFSRRLATRRAPASRRAWLSLPTGLALPARLPAAWAAARGSDPGAAYAAGTIRMAWADVRAGPGVAGAWLRHAGWSERCPSCC